MDPSSIPSPTAAGAWRQRHWDELLARIEDGKVVPIVGPDLVRVERQGASVTLEQYVALELAARLELPADQVGREPTLNQVMCVYFEHLPSGDTRTTPYTLIPDILRQARFVPPAPLRLLAEITDFSLFVTTTFDTLLTEALNAVRFDGAKGTESVAYRYNKTEDIAVSVAELRETGKPLVFHLLGQVSSSPTYVLTEEDLLEFVYALQSAEYRPRRLLAELAEHHLLIMGEHFSDWLARLFLRTTKGRKLSQSQEFTEVLADSRTSRETGLITFLSHFSTHTRVFPTGGAVEFVEELHRRWRERHPATAVARAPLPFVPPSREILKDAVFLSYAREDLDAVRMLKAALERAGLPVWFDLEQISSGQDWELRIHDNIESCALFLPVMSRQTESQRRKVYFRAEWNTARNFTIRNARGEVFIMPIVIDDLPREVAADEFPKVQIERAPGGDLPPKVIQDIVAAYARAVAAGTGT